MESNTEEFEPSIDINAGTLAKGEFREGKQLVAWDCIQECRDRCPIYHLGCAYKAVSKPCGLQTDYINNLTNTIAKTYRYLNDDMLFKVGMQLVPLYSQLCRQKIVEKSVLSLTYEDNKGVTRIHPIYKEIRETIKCITVVWREIGFTPIIPDPLNQAMGGRQGAGASGFGDPNHYRTITQNADNKRDIIR